MAKKAIKGRQARKTGGCSSGKPKPKPEPDRMARPGAEVKPPGRLVSKPSISPAGQAKIKSPRKSVPKPPIRPESQES